MIYTVTPNCIEPKCPHCKTGLYSHKVPGCLWTWWADIGIGQFYGKLEALQVIYDPLISIVFSHDDVSEAEFHFGDGNCHHAKQYDPSDGHGYTAIKVDDYYDKARGIEYLTESPETVYMKILILFNAIKGQPPEDEEAASSSPPSA